MTELVHVSHEHQQAPPSPPRGLARLRGPGYLRATWTTALAWAIGFGLVAFFRWLAHYDPILDWTILTVVAFLTLAPLGFLTGIGAFDYWTYYVSGRPTRPDDHSSHGATRWQDYFRVNTDHKVIGL